MIVVDTSVWIDVVNGVKNPYTEWYLRYSAIEKLALTDLILVEVLQGTRNAAEFDRTYRLLQTFAIHPGCGTLVAVEAARNYRQFRMRGITIRKTIDCLIATFCLENDHTLLHHDQDFDHFEHHLGLKVVKV